MRILLLAVVCGSYFASEGLCQWTTPAAGTRPTGRVTTGPVAPRATSAPGETVRPIRTPPPLERRPPLAVPTPAPAPVYAPVPPPSLTPPSGYAEPPVASPAPPPAADASAGGPHRRRHHRGAGRWTKRGDLIVFNDWRGPINFKLFDARKKPVGCKWGWNILPGQIVRLGVGCCFARANGYYQIKINDDTANVSLGEVGLFDGANWHVGLTRIWRATHATGPRLFYHNYNSGFPDWN